MSDELLTKLCSEWNANHPNKPCTEKDPEKVWEFLNAQLQSSCDKESCWLEQPFTKGKYEDEIRKSFAPEAPKSWRENPKEWLSSDELKKVMKQYERTYKCFKFLGPAPIDFDKMLSDGCVDSQICNFELQKYMDEGKTKLGFSFNTDTHEGGGEHWVSMFLNMKRRPAMLFYYDSAGEKASKEIEKLAQRIIKQGSELKPQPVKIEFDQNYPVEHQFKNTECGIYSLFFIIHMLEDKVTKEYLKTHIIKDDYMEQFRDVFFNEDL